MPSKDEHASRVRSLANISYSRRRPLRRGSATARKISFLPEWLWACALFLMTNPFALQLNGINPLLPGDQVEQPNALYLRAFIALLVSPVILARRRRVLGMLLANPAVLIFVLFAALSALWSESAYLTMRTAGSLCFVIWVAVAAGADLPPKAFLSAIVWSLLISMTFCVLYAVLLPTYGIEGAALLSSGPNIQAWRGIYEGKNILGMVSGLAVPALAFYRGNGWRPYIRIAATGIAIVCLVRSNSMSGLIVALSGFFLYVVFQLKGHAKVLAVFCWAAAMILFIVERDEVLDLVLHLLHRNATVTGRTYIWAVGYEMVEAHWLVGQGFGAFSTQSVRDTFAAAYSSTVAISDPHSAYLYLLIALGIVGLAIFLIAVVVAFFQALNAIRSQPQDRNILVTATIVTLLWLIEGFVESSPISPGGTVAAFGFDLVLFISYAHSSKGAPQRSYNPIRGARLKFGTRTA